MGYIILICRVLQKYVDLFLKWDLFKIAEQLAYKYQISSS